MCFLRGGAGDEETEDARDRNQLSRVLHYAFGTSPAGQQFKWRVMAVDSISMLRRAIADESRCLFSVSSACRALDDLQERLKNTAKYGGKVSDAAFTNMGRVRRLALATKMMHGMQTVCVEGHVQFLLDEARSGKGLSAGAIPRDLGQTIDMAKRLTVGDEADRRTVAASIEQLIVKYSLDSLRGEIGSMLNKLGLERDWHAKMLEAESDISSGALVRIADLKKKEKS